MAWRVGASACLRLWPQDTWQAGCRPSNKTRDGRLRIALRGVPPPGPDGLRLLVNNRGGVPAFSPLAAFQQFTITDPCCSVPGVLPMVGERLECDAVSDPAVRGRSCGASMLELGGSLVVVSRW